MSLQTPPRNAWTRPVYEVLAWLFTLCILVQVLFAGLLMFVSTTWAADFHTKFPDIFGAIPIVMLVLALIGKFRNNPWLYILPIIAVGLVTVQYTLGGSGGGYLMALHPVNAVLIFGVGLINALQVRQWRAAQKIGHGPTAQRAVDTSRSA